MLLSRYFNRDLMHMFLLTLLILLVIVISNMVMRYLTIFSGQNVSSNVVFQLIGVMLPKYIAYLIPLSLFFSMLLVYGKWFANNELTVAFACGFSWLRLFAANAWIVGSLFLIQLVLTLWVLPVVDQNYTLVQQASKTQSVESFITPGQMTSIGSGNQVIYVDKTDHNGMLYDIFLYQKNSKNQQQMIVTAPKGWIEVHANQNRFVVLENGYYYQIDSNDKTVLQGQFNRLERFIFGKVDPKDDTSIEGVPTTELFNSHRLDYQAELQWRISFALILWVSLLIALAISKIQPRQSRYRRIVPGVLIFIIYFNLLSLSKKWIVSGILPTWIGLWWVHIVFAMIMLVILKKYQGPIRQQTGLGVSLS